MSVREAQLSLARFGRRSARTDDVPDSGSRTSPADPAVPDGPRPASRLLRAVVGFLLLEALLVSGRVELFHPIDFASDTSNYAAAGQRVAADHELYTLSAGDRPVPADNPPFWTVPLLSPPGAAIIWAPAALAGLTTFAIVLWWALGAAMTFAWTIFVAIRGSLGAVLLAGLLAPMTAVTAISGNLNAILMPVIVASWYLSRDAASPRRSFAGGFVVAFGAWVKLTPILILPWLVATKRWSAVLGTMVGLATFGLVGLAIAGWNAHVEFLTAGAQSATAGVTGAGPETLLLLLGVPAAIARLTPAVVAVASVLWVFTFRAKPSWAFVGAIAGVVMVTPVIRWESYSVLLAAAAPWVESRQKKFDQRKLGAAIAGAAALIVIGSMAVSMLVGSSSAGVRSSSSQTTIVRFVGPDRTSASFGYSVPPGLVGWAWVNEAGQFHGDVVVFDANCRQLFRGPVTSSAIEVDIDGAGGATVATPMPGSIPDPARLSYTSQCEQEFGPPRP
jgi:hypothetical protein